MSVGRPSSYLPEYCDLLQEHMTKGLSFESFAGVVGVSKQTLYDWTKAHPEFLDAKEVGLEKSRIFWENLGITRIVNESESVQGMGSSSKSLNASVWIFNMKNRFGWRDKQPGEDGPAVVQNTIQVSDDQLANLIRVARGT